MVEPTCPAVPQAVFRIQAGNTLTISGKEKTKWKSTTCFQEKACPLCRELEVIDVPVLFYEEETAAATMAPIPLQTLKALSRPLSQVGARRKRCPGQFGQDGMGSIPATPSTKHALCFPPSSMPASIEISIKLIVCLKALKPSF